MGTYSIYLGRLTRITRIYFLLLVEYIGLYMVGRGKGSGAYNWERGLWEFLV